MLQSLQDFAHGLLVGIVDASVVVKVRNQRLGHLTEIAFIKPCDRMALKLAVYQVPELHLPLLTRYSHSRRMAYICDDLIWGDILTINMTKVMTWF